jgi:hypothetical protein
LTTEPVVLKVRGVGSVEERVNERSEACAVAPFRATRRLNPDYCYRAFSSNSPVFTSPWKNVNTFADSMAPNSTLIGSRMSNTERVAVGRCGLGPWAFILCGDPPLRIRP